MHSLPLVASLHLSDFFRIMKLAQVPIIILLREKFLLYGTN
jgi:hypothetical protein